MLDYHTYGHCREIFTVESLCNPGHQWGKRNCSVSNPGHHMGQEKVSVLLRCLIRDTILQRSPYFLVQGVYYNRGEN